MKATNIMMVSNDIENDYGEDNKSEANCQMKMTKMGR